ncbi:MAG: DUF86 domain-containing protein [Chloroflexota bacterium]
MNREYADFFRDMLENAQRAIRFTEGMDYKSFSKDEKTVYAVIRAVKSSGKPPQIFQRKFVPNIPSSPGARSEG